jgi:hypothetical protein
MSFVDEMYKPEANLYTDEKNCVHSMYIVSAIKNAMIKNKNARKFKDWKLVFYSSDAYDTGLDPVRADGYYDGIGVKLNWAVIKKLIINEVNQADLGLKTFNVSIVDVNCTRTEDTYSLSTFGKRKYKTVSDIKHEIWVSASW